MLHEQRYRSANDSTGSIQGDVIIELGEDWSDHKVNGLSVIFSILKRVPVQGNIRILGTLPKEQEAVHRDENGENERRHQKSRGLAHQLFNFANAGEDWQVHAWVEVGQDADDVEAPDAVLATMKIDTQSRNNWVSAAAVARFGMEEHLEKIPKGHRVTAFGGESFEPEHKILLTWHAKGGNGKRRTEFLVNPKYADFDLLVGQVFINRSGFDALWGEGVHVLRENKKSKGQYSVTIEATELTTCSGSRC
jgi:hypothetical protein